ncbi:hypothetical protein N1031_12205 [Herbiconiux moechotypicola]|uniref:Uncharacterized protein n=1 Tax=Herbiconiux moechotypicola TaxID=637393 RepID=A0ABN3DTF8_9MICO|nr:hypothetical protein [Herbiconiux moechotypicola]MCS5730526.1 hypothetical protein [Herbiconiux moechotypicola]
MNPALWNTLYGACLVDIRRHGATAVVRLERGERTTRFEGVAVVRLYGVERLGFWLHPSGAWLPQAVAASGRFSISEAQLVDGSLTVNGMLEETGALVDLEFVHDGAVVEWVAAGSAQE